jgi:GNAT superfamily N-acetyltransferase
MRAQEFLLENKQLDPDLYDEVDPGFVARTVKQTVPDARVRVDNREGTVQVTSEDGLSLYIGANIAEGGYGIYVSGGEGAVQGGGESGRVTAVIAAVAQALVKKYGVPSQTTTLTVDSDHGHGVWQRIAQKLGLQYEAGGVAESVVMTEIERLRARDYQGGKDEIEYVAKRRAGLTPLPGGSGLLYNVQGDKYFPMIVIWDPNGPDARPSKPQPIGKLSLERAEYRIPIPGALQVGSITVDEDYRGRGIAKSLYGIVLSVMRRPLIAGGSQTPGGRQNWVSLAQIPGVEVRGFVSIGDNDIDNNIRGKNIIDTLMGRLGAEYIGETKNNQHVFAFDVQPGRSEQEMEAVVNTILSRVYNEHPDVTSGLYAVWTGA